MMKQTTKYPKMLNKKYSGKTSANITNNNILKRMQKYQNFHKMYSTKVNDMSSLTNSLMGAADQLNINIQYVEASQYIDPMFTYSLAHFLAIGTINVMNYKQSNIYYENAEKDALFWAKIVGMSYVKASLYTCFVPFTDIWILWGLQLVALFFIFIYKNVYIYYPLCHICIINYIDHINLIYIYDIMGSIYTLCHICIINYIDHINLIYLIFKGIIRLLFYG